MNQLAAVERQSNPPAVWAGNDKLAKLWGRMRLEWLRHCESKSRSRHTRRAYDVATKKWLRYLRRHDLAPWNATSRDVRLWMEELNGEGLAPATVNAYLSAASSWYTFIINERHLVEGIERTAFFDAAGQTRANPFRTGNLRRPIVHAYGKANPLPIKDLRKLFAYLYEHSNTLSGSRNYALLLTFFLTACRNNEVVSLKWGAIRESRAQSGAYVYLWRGKGGREETAPMPERAYEAIVAYLQKAGRLAVDSGDGLAPDPEEYIFPPLVDHGTCNLVGNEPRRHGHISAKNAVRILHHNLRKAGVTNGKQYRVHDLRHTFAHLYDGDLETLRRILHHDSLETTGIYKRTLADPVDNYSEDLWSQLSL